MDTDVTVKVTTISDILDASVLSSQDDGFQLQPFVFPAGRAGAIAYMDNFLLPSFCDDLIQFCTKYENSSFAGKTMGGVNYKFKVSRDWRMGGICSDAEFVDSENEFDKVIFSRLWKTLDNYKGSYPALTSPDSADFCIVSDTGYQIQKYLQNIGFYNAHIDGAPWVGSARDRTLGVVIYLNTVSDGGGTHFPLHQVTVEAVQGRIAIFPAYWTHLHEGLMPLSSDKWIVSTFITAFQQIEGSSGQCTCEPTEGETI